MGLTRKKTERYSKKLKYHSGVGYPDFYLKSDSNI